MIDPKSLRIGNTVQWNNKPIDITAKDLIYLLTMLQKKQKFESYQPIPLSEQDLIRLGFTVERFTTGGYELWMTRTSKGRIIKIFDKKFTWGAGEYSDYILYVHQLQNLYYSLTGEELNYKAHEQPGKRD